LKQILLLIIIIVNAGGHAARPENIAAEVGSTVRLRCGNEVSSNATVHWDNFARDNPTVYTGHEMIKPLQQRYKTEFTGHQHHLVVNDVRLSDAGNYSCYEHSHRPKNVVLLTVLRSMFIYLFYHIYTEWAKRFSSPRSTSNY